VPEERDVLVEDLIVPEERVVLAVDLVVPDVLPIEEDLLVELLLNVFLVDLGFVDRNLELRLFNVLFLPTLLEDTRDLSLLIDLPLVLSLKTFILELLPVF
jgi:hypothetical protein